MEPLTSKSLNNQIVSMRKEVRKAVVHQIHGLTQKANKLRLKKGSDEQIKKNSLKADSFVTEIQILKKLKPDDVSVFALSNPKSSDLKIIISKPIISAETKSIAKLCLRENIQKTVNEFISNYSDSLELLNDLLSERCSKGEKKVKKKKKKAKKPNVTNKSTDGSSQKVDINKKKAEREALEILSDSSDSVPQLISMDDSKSENDVYINMENDSDVPEHFSGSDSNDLSNSDTASVEQTDDEDGIHTDTITSDPNDNFLNKNGNSVSKEKNKLDKNSRDVNNSENYSIPVLPERKKVDPFFKTSNDSEYYTYCDVGNKVEEPTFNSDKHSNGSECQAETNTRNKEYSFKKGFGGNNSLKRSFNSGPRDNSFKRGYSSKTPFQRNPDNTTFFKRNFHDKKSFNENLRIKPFNNSSNINKKEKYKVPSDMGRQNNFINSDKREIKKSKQMKTEQPVILHPSWEAKKKLNQVVVPFQGKKIVFDD